MAITTPALLTAAVNAASGGSCPGAGEGVVSADFAVITTPLSITVTDNNNNGSPLIASEPVLNIALRFDAPGRTFSVNGGPLMIGNSGNLALGGINSITVNATGGTSVAAGAFLNVGTSTFTSTRPITLNGGTLKSNGPATVNAPIVLAADSDVAASGGVLNLSGAISGNFTLRVFGAGLHRFSGVGSSFARLNITSGTTVLGGNNALPPQIDIFNGNRLNLNGFSQSIDFYGGIGHIENTGGVADLVFGVAGSTSSLGNAAFIGSINGPINVTYAAGCDQSIGSSNSTYVGTTNVLGKVAVFDVGTRAFGAIGAGNETTIAATGILDLQNVGYAVNEALIVNGGVLQTSFGISNFPGNVTLNASTATLDVRGLVNELTLTGVVTGSQGFSKTGGGVLRLTQINSYLGPVTISAGSVLVTGSTDAASAVTVGGTGLLGGTGSVNGSVNVQSGGSLAPGLSPGLLSTGNTSLNAGAAFVAEINGATAGSQYDQLGVTGSVALGNANLSLTGSYSPLLGNTFVLINNDGSDAIAGTFNGLAQGASFNFNGAPMRISYVGGTGNDVVLNYELPSVAINDVTIAEGNAGSINAAFTVTRSSNVTAFAVDIATGGGSATAGTDYSAVNATLNFTAGGALMQTLNVPIVGDNIIELNETFNVSLSNATNGTTLADATGVGTITNDDIPNLTIANVTLAENAGPAVVRISLNSAAVVGPVTGTFSTADGTANATSDYTAQIAVPFSIPANATFVDVSIPITNDATFEPSESFTVTVAGVSGATVTGATGTVSITDDDQQPTTTTIVSDLPDPSVTGQSYAVNVQVAALSSSPGGTVNVGDGSANCVITLIAGASPNSSGTCNLISTSTGNKTITATYVPASTAFAASTITTTHLVNPAATSLVFNAPPARSRIFQSLPFAVTFAVAAPGAGSPVGTITLTSGGSICTINVPTATPSCLLQFNTLGARTINASFVPSDGNFTTSSSTTAANTLVFAQADLAVTKDNGVSSYAAGDLLVYTLILRNNGPDFAPGVRFSDLIPTILLNPRWSCAASGNAICPQAGGVTDINATVNQIPVGGVLTYTLSANVPRPAPASISNRAEVFLPGNLTIDDLLLGNQSQTDIDTLQLVFAHSFEAPGIASLGGEFIVPSLALNNWVREVATVVYQLDDAKGEALRIYGREFAGKIEFALATRDASGLWTLGGWQSFADEPRLSWTARAVEGGFLLESAQLR